MENLSFFNALMESTGKNLPTVISAIVILAAGWVAALSVRALMVRLLKKLRINERLSSSTGASIDLEHPLALACFLLVLLFVLVMALNVLNVPIAAGPFVGLLDKILKYVPQLMAGGFLCVVAWLVATLLRGLTNKLFDATTFDEKLATEAQIAPISHKLGNVLFWLTILLFLPAILDAFMLQGLLTPVQGMVDRLLVMLPNIFAAATLGFVGWILAKVLRALTVNLLGATGIDKLGTSAGMDQSVRLSSLAGTLVFIFVFVPSLIAALDALKIEAISRPATDMLQQFMSAIPNVFAAVVILTVSYYVAKFAASLIDRLLSNIGFNSLPEKLGLQNLFSTGPRASNLVASTFIFFTMLFATVEAANRLGFSQVRDVVTLFIKFGGDVLLGATILMIGFWLANIAYIAISRTSGGASGIMANIARIAILGLVLAMGLRAMGIADDIVNLAFGLMVGAIAVAFGLAFGLGGREAAGKQLEFWFAKLRNAPEIKKPIDSSNASD